MHAKLENLTSEQNPQLFLVRDIAVRDWTRESEASSSDTILSPSRDAHSGNADWHDHASQFAAWSVDFRSMVSVVERGGVLEASPELQKLAEEVATAISAEPAMDEGQVREWADKLAQEAVEFEDD